VSAQVAGSLRLRRQHGRHGAPNYQMHAAELAPADLDDALRFLASPAARASRAPPEVVETHMSWVFIGPEHVLKLKKPVRTEFLDFSTLAAREFNCREEVRLNRRLAPDVYLGVTPLVRDANGRLALGSKVGAEILDWLVVMRPLPRSQMLDVALAAGTVRTADIDRLAARLAQFFRSAARVSLNASEYLRRIRVSQAANRAVLLNPRFAEVEAAAALSQFDRALAHHASAVGARAAQGHVREGHGDLRPEHICLLDPPVVIDCLEFNRMLREVDPYDELAFLGLECRMLGADWIGPRLLAQIGEVLGNAPPPAVLALYGAQRALVRARLAAAHLFDPQPRMPQHWLPQARRYVAQAHAELVPLLRN
jgi:aminoglycoside phosphotransferase family enzyme